MGNHEMKAVIEGLLFAAGEDGLSTKEIADVTGLARHEVELLIHDMRVDWKETGRGLQIVKVAQVYQMTTLPEHRPYFEKLAQAPTRSQLSRAALETLAIIAYRQPITRLETEEIRGVKSDRIIQQLQRKGLIRDVGRAEGAGRPILYGTTKEFLEYFGLNHIDELPPPDSIFNWQEWEQDRKDLFQRLGVEPNEEQAKSQTDEVKNEAEGETESEKKTESVQA
ncbi:SMC-Scp complex subunit ScpB [Paenactinomyces guangxiensis]|uniref:Segregation and condensation protein B n=1 Tax=Paenactinomyces guangxiensis TaxID=1490290 RepID=A0A7W2AAA1_9BACL|nr:SMC-Scp complex subunit ScpB [Paenactinomyces guangxiensis]MBA4495678.1 SMC-Scp complex subunit ScpB [Paenactinomyces guangxiensis]MBH8592666.1 SMC-Scp complex subunit ScpB [Paenactinomyces guangxiensis]